MKFNCFVLLLSVLLSPSFIVGAELTNTQFASLSEVIPDLPGKNAPSALRSILEDPATLNRAVRDLFVDDNPLRKLFDVANIKLKMFDSDKPGKQTSLGFTYDFSKDISSYYINKEKAKHDALTLSLSARGNVAFNRKANPRDFLDAKASFLGFRSRGGALATTPDVQEQLNTLEDLAAQSKTREEFLKNPAAVEAARIIRVYLTTQYYIELAADGGIEADQTFSKKQYVYGGHLALDIKGWNSESPWAKFNLFDYPFALTRLLLGNDTTWSPRGSALPTVLVGIDQVIPTGNDPRARAGDTSDFARLRFEASYRTLVGHITGQAVFFEADVRYYQELYPSAAVKAASADHSTVFTAVLLLPKGAFVSYSTGRLPFDLQNSRVYEVGFHYSF